METKPIQKLADKVGKIELANLIGVDLSLVYLWLRRESGKDGRRPGLANALELERVATRYGVKDLTIEYLSNL